MSDREKQVEKINKLLKLGEKNSNPAERRAARAKAYQMMLDYDIAEEEVIWPKRYQDEQREAADNEKNRQEADAFQREKEAYEFEQAKIRQKQAEETARAEAQNHQKTYEQSQRYNAQAAVKSKAKEPPRWLTVAIGGLIVFGIISIIWPWSMKALFMSAGAVLVLINLRYIVVLVGLVALGAFFETMVK